MSEQHSTAALREADERLVTLLQERLVPHLCRHSGDEQIAVVGDGSVQHGALRLVPLVPQLVAADDASSNLAALGRTIRGTVPVQPARRSDHYLRGRGGSVITVEGDLTEYQLTQVRAGDMTPLSEPQIRAYLDGESIPADHYLVPASGGAVIEVYGRPSPHYQRLLADGILRELAPAEATADARGGGRGGG